MSSQLDEYAGLTYRNTFLDTIHTNAWRLVCIKFTPHIMTTQSPLAPTQENTQKHQADGNSAHRPAKRATPDTDG
jgi:hypothetical protein